MNLKGEYKKYNNGRNKGLMRNHNLHEIRTRRFLMFVAKKKPKFEALKEIVSSLAHSKC